MIKSIFADPLNLKGIDSTGANHVIITQHDLTNSVWKKLESSRVTLGISIGAFDYSGCPADPKAKVKLISRLNEALKFQPDEIWLDHFRFDGHWEAIKRGVIPDIHKPCRWCLGLNRAEFLEKMAREIVGYIKGKTKVGYFAVPFKDKDVPDLVEKIGQRHSKIGKIFDLVSPMLYHRMIQKPVSYISEYVTYLTNLTSKPILPIIQIKDMPDDLEDRLSESEFKQSAEEAIKDPSVGVSIFMWRHALEKNKTDLISKVFSLI